MMICKPMVRRTGGRSIPASGHHAARAMAAAAGSILLGAVLMAAGATPARAQPACAPATAEARIAVPMLKSAEKAETDPAGIWTRWEMWNPATPARTTIWRGSAASCQGEVIVSQIVNRQCSSAVECPARIVLRHGDRQRVLLDYRQICTLRETFQLHADLSALDACGQSFALDTPAR